MRVPIYAVAVPILAVVAFAQDTQPTQPKQPETAPSKTTSPKNDQTKADQTKGDQAKGDQTKGDQTAMPEMKTQTYSGTLVDASCAGSGSAPAATAAAGSTSSADRTAKSDTSQGGCTVSANTTQFALKLKDGNTVRFDDVGNTRAQEAMKTHKKWTESATANKPVRVKASGVLSGDKLTVLSVN